MIDKSSSNLSLVDSYLHGQFKNVKGWCIPQLWNVIQPIHAYQESLGCKQPIAEIGVYHGKFFIGLAKTKSGYGPHHAIDVFDMQQFNLDGAGQGNLDILKSNLNGCNISDKDVVFRRADSMTLHASDIENIRQASRGGFSMFSVDGCHMVEHTINDFRIASQLTVPEGIIFIDDFTNVDWPGVQEAMGKIFTIDSPRFVPLACLANKLFLCHISYHQDYLKLITNFIAKNYPTTRKKHVKRYGYDSINVHVEHAKDRYLVEF